MVPRTDHSTPPRIGSAFALSESWADHVKRFRDERVARISGDDTPTKVRDTTRLSSTSSPSRRLDGGLP